MFYMLNYKYIEEVLLMTKTRVNPQILDLSNETQAFQQKLRFISRCSHFCAPFTLFSLSSVFGHIPNNKNGRGPRNKYVLGWAMISPPEPYHFPLYHFKAFVNRK